MLAHNRGTETACGGSFHWDGLAKPCRLARRITVPTSRATPRSSVLGRVRPYGCWMVVKLRERQGDRGCGKCARFYIHGSVLRGSRLG